MGTAYRVPENTSPDVNARIRESAEESVERTAAGGPGAIGERLRELDEEWDIERTLQTNAASISLVGLALGALVNRKFLALPAIVAGFLLQHALQGWCPPLPAFRRMGVRTQREIDEERHALKALRGDFAGVAAGNGGIGHARQALDAASRR